MSQLRNTLLVLILLASISGVAYVFLQTKGHDNKPNVISASPQLPQTIAQAKEKVRKVTSSDGAQTLTMKIDMKDKTTTYSFYINDALQPFYTETYIGDSYSLGVPDNTWSPGEKYVFLERNGGGAKTDIVFKTDGTAFSNGEKFLDAGQLFKNRGTNYTFAGGTGWASSTLLIVESTKADGSRGPSFWFELPAGNYIQLSSYQ